MSKRENHCPLAHQGDSDSVTCTVGTCNQTHVIKYLLPFDGESGPTKSMYRWPNRRSVVGNGTIGVTVCLFVWYPDTGRNTWPIYWLGDWCRANKNASARRVARRKSCGEGMQRVCMRYFHVFSTGRKICIDSLAHSVYLVLTAVVRTWWGLIILFVASSASSDCFFDHWDTIFCWDI